MNQLKRVEIIANCSVEADIMDIFRERELAKHFTKITGVHGCGNSEPKYGDHIWPEENFILIIYSQTEETEAIVRAVEEVRLRFPDEGIRCFVMR